jgi:plastocyanin
MRPLAARRFLSNSILTFAILAAVAALVTACASSATAGAPPAGSASGSSGQSAGAQATSPQPVTVQMNDANKFVPATLSVPVGTTVTWTNVGQVTHDVTTDASMAIKASDVSLPAGAQPFSSGDINGGQSYSYTFTTPGTYHYVCIPHEVLGMLGTITVTN